MRFEGLRAKGLGVFRDEVEIDFASLPGVVTAIAGGNGQGKSTLLELLYAGAFRDTPTRGSLVDLARDRDAFLEVRLTNGASHVMRHTLDSVSKKSEALILDAAGAPVLPTTSVKAFDEWARAHLPAPEVVLSSLFAAQQHGGFCDLSARERKQALCELLGLQEFEGMAERARRRAGDSREALAAVAGELRALPDLDPAALEAALGAARAEAETAERGLTAARAEQEAATVYRAKAAALIADRAALTDVETRLANNRLCLRDAEQIRAAVTRSAAIDAEVADLRRDATIGAARAAEIDRAGREARGRAQRALDAIRTATGRADAARGRLALRPAIEKARAELPIAQQHVVDLQRRADEIGEELSAIQASMLGGAEARITALRQGLDDVLKEPEHADALNVARAALDADDRRGEAQRTGPARARAAKDRISELAVTLSQARGRVSDVERHIAREGEIVAAERELAEAIGTVAASKIDEQAASADALRLDCDLDACRSAGRDLDARIDALEEEQRSIAPLVRKAAPLADAEQKIAMYEPRAAELRAKIAETEAALAAMPEPHDADVFGAERRFQLAHAAIGRLEGDLARAEETERRRTELGEKRQALELDLADWALLGEDLGASGLPALLIDAAGPELTTLVNDLLHTCVGTRFTVSIETTRASADGRKAIETCEVRVLDTEGGREAPVETFSGGERAICGEAVALALTMLACRRSGLEGVTLIRDETAAALDEANGRAYVAMLRRAAEIVHASRVLFVAHDKQLQELADARIVVADGRVSVS
jgi:exonuclease SbcC